MFESEFLNYLLQVLGFIFACIICFIIICTILDGISNFIAYKRRAIIALEEILELTADTRKNHGISEKECIVRIVDIASRTLICN